MIVSLMVMNTMVESVKHHPKNRQKNTKDKKTSPPSAWTQLHNPHVFTQPLHGQSNLPHPGE